MIRTILAIAGIFAAILWLPLWAQLALFAVGVIVLPHRLALFIPAAFADALYAPAGISIAGLKYTLVVAALIIVHWVIVHKTRVKDFYAVEAK
ncbi:MAG TPA: hypothetical protein VGE18_01125 [Candidatus Paceibacterota bacterium]